MDLRLTFGDITAETALIDSHVCDKTIPGKKYMNEKHRHISTADLELVAHSINGCVLEVLLICVT